MPQSNNARRFLLIVLAFVAIAVVSPRAQIGCPNHVCQVDAGGIQAVNAAIQLATCGDEVRVSGRIVTDVSPLRVVAKSPECTEATRIRITRVGPLPIAPDILVGAGAYIQGPDFETEQARKEAFFEQLKTLYETGAPAFYTPQSQACTGSGSPIWIDPRASYYDLDGFIATTENEGVDGIDGCPVYGLVIMGVWYQTGLNVDKESDLPHHIRFNRMVLKGTKNGDVIRGIFGEGRYIEVTNSLCYDMHASVYDSQCFYASNGTGPFEIFNNFFRAAGENILFGGSDPLITGAIPRGIRVHHNVLDKDWSWWRQADHVGRKFTARVAWTVKNLGECKSCIDAWWYDNLMDGSWEANQAGGALLFQGVKNGPSCNWCTVKDVWVFGNIIRNAASGLALGGYGGQYGGGQPIMARVRFIGNLLYNISVKFSQNGTNWGACWRLVSGSASSPDPTDAFDDVEINHNTCINDGGGFGALLDSGDKFRRLKVKNNIGRQGFDYYATAIAMASGTDSTLDGWRIMTIDSEGGLSRNLIAASANQPGWPQPNWLLQKLNDVQGTKQLFDDLFVDAAHNDFHLKPGSIYGAGGTRAADDGTAIGVDFAKLPGGARATEPPPPQDFTSYPSPAPSPIPTPTPVPEPPPPVPAPDLPPAPPVCTYQLSKSSEVMPSATAGTVSVIVTPSMPNCALQVSAIPGVPAQTWLTWKIDGWSVTFSVAANITLTSRSTAVYVGGQQTFAVMQQGGAPVPTPVPVLVPTPAKCELDVIKPESTSAATWKAKLTALYADGWRMVGDGANGMVILERGVCR